MAEEDQVSEEENVLPHHFDSISCQELLVGLPDDILLREDFVRFGGSYFRDSKSNELEVFVRDRFKDSARDFKLFRLVRSASQAYILFRLCPDGFPSGDLLEGFDLSLQKSKSLHLNIIDEPGYQAKLYASVQKSAEDLKERAVSLQSSFVDFVVVPGFVSLTGSYIYHSPDRKPNDIDIVVKSSEEMEGVVEVLRERIEKLIGEIKVQFIWEPRGPNSSFLPLYDLILKVRNVQEAFHIRDTHWVPVPSSGSCPVSHPNKLKSPQGETRCYTSTAARALRGSVQEAQERALKVSDPEFIIDRLKAGKPVITLSSRDRSSLAGQTLVLLGKKVKESEPVKAWGRVKFEQTEKTIANVSALGRRSASLGENDFRKFQARRGPFFVLNLELVTAFAKPKTLKSPPPGRAFSSTVDLTKDVLQEVTVLSGVHSHPHESNGRHEHRGFPPGGGHEHIAGDSSLSLPSGGGHAHREGDPLEGFHLNFEEDDGSHQHILALVEESSIIRQWADAVVAAHFPFHKWLPGHRKTFIQHVGRDEEPFEATEENWIEHLQWMHSSGMHRFRHERIFTHEEPFIMKWYEFEDGTKRPATSEDFALEEKWMQENLPFPIEAF